jgi:hypothetical protein
LQIELDLIENGVKLGLTGLFESNPTR